VPETSKAIVTLGGVPLGATQAIAWRFVSGVAPYVTEFAVPKATWTGKLRGRTGVPLELRIVDSRGVDTRIQGVYILHTAPSDSPNRVHFVVADVRWKWPYKLVAMDFNMTRKTGDRTAFQSVPVETQVSVDQYDFLAYSLDKDDQGAPQKWTAQNALEEVLKQVALDAQGRPNYHIESFPIPQETSGNEGQFTIQNVSLRDAGDAAIARLLSYIPGTDIYIDKKGQARVFDTTDLGAAEDRLGDLPPRTWAGEFPAIIDRKKIRPQAVRVHYQREVECLFRFKDLLAGTATPPLTPQPDDAFLENVIATPDPVTFMTEYDPVSNRARTVAKAVGTWVEFSRWLNAMDQQRPLNSFPWTFDTIKRLWVLGNLEGALGAGGKDLDDDANIAMRVQTIKEHFRQTFRVNRKYMERIRDIRAVRVGLLDPVTGARAPARVWGQYAVIPTEKGYMVTARTDPSQVAYARNVDCLAASADGTNITRTTPGVQTITVEDEEVGILRVEGVQSPFGTTASFVPCLLVNAQEQTRVPIRDLRRQDEQSMGFGMRMEGGSDGIFLANSMKLAAMLTITPAAPNNKFQFHVVEVKARDVAEIYRIDYQIQGGEGPTLEVFIPPGEMTARFAWDDDLQASTTIKHLLGLGDVQGIDGTNLPGFILCNGERSLTGHALAVAAEMLAPFADALQGTVATAVPDDALRLVGNNSSVTVRVDAAPSAKVSAITAFPGQQRPISRLALMPESTRRIVLGIVPFR